MLRFNKMSLQGQLYLTQSLSVSYLLVPIKPLSINVTTECCVVTGTGRGKQFLKGECMPDRVLPQTLLLEAT